MDLKTNILSSYLAFENKIDINSDVHEIRSQALQTFEAIGFPNKKVRSLEIHFVKSLF